MAADGKTPNLTSITVRDLTFDGGGGQNSGIDTEVRFQSVKSLLITNCAFMNSPFFALSIGGNPVNGYTSGAVVNKIVLDTAGYLGILSSSTPGNGYLTCSSYAYSSNIVIANSTFRNVGANAIAIEANGVRIVNNTLQHNHDTAPYNMPGGQIYVEICADDVAIVNNQISDAPVTSNGFYGEGIELHGTNLVVVDNTVTRNAGAGIQMSGVQNVFIANWTPGTGVISNNFLAPHGAGGIDLYNAAPGDNTNYRQVDFVTIDHAVSINGALTGIGIFLQRGQTTPINHVVITNNCLAGNVAGPTGLSGLGPNFLIANNLSTGCPQ